LSEVTIVKAPQTLLGALLFLFAATNVQAATFSFVDSSTGLEWLEWPLAPVTNNPANPFPVNPDYGVGWRVASLSEWAMLVTDYNGKYPCVGNDGCGTELFTRLGLVDSGGTFPTIAWLSDVSGVLGQAAFVLPSTRRYSNDTEPVDTSEISLPVALVRVAVVPEPSTTALFGVSLLIVGLAARRRRA
jgi:hypothetical protein